MKKSSTDHLLSPAFGRMCMANFLLFASVYLLCPLLAFEAVDRWNISLANAGWMYLLFILGMLMVGPFHAYLGDACKRKGVLIYAQLGVSLTMLGYVFATSYTYWLVLALVQGICFGLATTAGITVAIDIVVSARRSACNKWFALSARIGMVVGVLASVMCGPCYGFSMTTGVAVAALVLACLCELPVYVAFRAPIGLPLLNIDRFFLPLGWMPAVNLLLVGFSSGVLFPLLDVGHYGALILLLAILLIVVPFTRMFVKLSHHCQRGTANTTCQLAIDAGILAGYAAGLHWFSEGSHETLLYEVALIGVLVSIVFYCLLTRPYYRKYRVR